MWHPQGTSGRGLALLCLAVAAALGGCAHTPGVPLERLQIGDSVATVQRALNSRVQPVPSTSSVEREPTAINLPERGIWVFFSAGALYTIRFDAPFAGNIDGLVIGETRQALIARRGSPTRTLPQMRRTPSLPDPYLYRLADGTTLRADFDAAERIQTIYVTAGAVQFADTHAVHSGSSVAPPAPLPPMAPAESPTQPVPQPPVTAAPSSSPGQAREFGIFLGGAASEYDLCAWRGFAPRMSPSAQEQAEAFLEQMQRQNHDPQGVAEARKGWEELKVQLAAHADDFTAQRCEGVIAQWGKYLAILHAR